MRRHGADHAYNTTMTLWKMLKLLHKIEASEQVYFKSNLQQTVNQYLTTIYASKTGKSDIVFKK